MRCGQKFPDFYEKYGLDEVVMSKMTDIVDDAREYAKEDPSWADRLRKRWNLV